MAFLNMDHMVFDRPPKYSKGVTIETTSMGESWYKTMGPTVRAVEVLVGDKFGWGPQLEKC